jgi:hypothetical protein
MKVPKEKHRVSIVCTDRTVLQGIIFVDEGLRVSDFLNATRDRFIIVSEASFSNLGKMSFHLNKAVLSKKAGTVILNKLSIKWMEDLGKHE